jgi:hypothetical protein
LVKFSRLSPSKKIQKDHRSLWADRHTPSKAPIHHLYKFLLADSLFQNGNPAHGTIRKDSVVRSGSGTLASDNALFDTS